MSISVWILFCSKILWYTYRLRPISDMIDEVQSLHRKLIMFNDDNILGNLSYSKELFSTLTPLKKKWFGQARYPDWKMLKCRMAGQEWMHWPPDRFESLSRSNLIQSQKYQNDPAEYREIIDTLHRFGITSGIFHLRFDEDDPPSLRRQWISLFEPNFSPWSLPFSPLILKPPFING